MDLEASADYIARASSYYAAAFVREARDAARSLRNFANRGRVVPEFEDPAIR
jgi:plasmid stabilization system protein ParE